MRYLLSIIVVVFMFSSSICAEEQRCTSTGMFFDNNLPDIDPAMFDDRDTSLPKAGDFELVSYYLMSNVCGWRAALVTVKNTSSGARTLKGEHIVALMANGEKRAAGLDKRLSGFESENFMIDYGISNMPVIKILVKTR